MKKTTFLLSALLIFLFYTSNTFSQGLVATFTGDGTNCEWSPTPDMVDTDPGIVDPSANLLNVWVGQSASSVFVAFSREFTGRRGFSVYIDTDCNPSTGSAAYGGADKVAFFIVGPSGNPAFSNITIYNWSGAPLTGSWVSASTNSFSVWNGRSICADAASFGLFFEMSFPIASLFPCSDSCDKIRITRVGSHTDVFDNILLDSVTTDLSLTLNTGPVVTFLATAPYCSSRIVNFDASASTHSTLGAFQDYLAKVEWDFNYNGTTFVPNAAYTSTGTLTVPPNFLASFTYGTVGTKRVALKITDRYGCFKIVERTIVVTLPPIAAILSQVNTNTNTGIATAGATSGTPPYTYLWNDPGAQTTATAIGLSQGSYTVTVTDSKGCTSTKTVIITSVDQQAPFEIRYNDTFKGGIVYLSNNSLSRHATNNFNITAGGGTLANPQGSNDFAIQVHVDVDTDPATFNSSTSDLNLTDNCTDIAFAGLYWAGTYPYEAGKVIAATGYPDIGCSDCNRYDPRNIKFKLPGTANYVDLVGTKIYDEFGLTTPTSNQGAYACFVDVTSLVKGNSNGYNGTYSVANVRAAKNNIRDTNLYYGTAAGWTLVVVYENNEESVKSFTVYDGFAYINGYAGSFGLGGVNQLDFTYYGFNTVPTGPVKGSYGLATLEGDRTIVGSSLQLLNTTGSFVNLTDAVNPTDNYFNSTISHFGSHVLTRTPQSLNTLGYDSDILRIDPATNNIGNSLIGNSQTSATFRARSNNSGTARDAYFIYLSSLAVEVYKPDVQVVKSMYDSVGTLIPQNGTVNPLDTITYQLSIQNLGNDTAQNVILTDALPFNATFNPLTLLALDSGGLPINLTTGAPTITNPIQYSYNAVTNTLTFNLHSSLVEAFDPIFYIKFNVVVTNDHNLLISDCSQKLRNRVTSSYVGTINTNINIQDQESLNYIAMCSNDISALEPTTANINISSIVFPTYNFNNPACATSSITSQNLVDAGINMSLYNIYSTNSIPPDPADIVPVPITGSGNYYAIGLLDNRFEPCYGIFPINVTLLQRPNPPTSGGDQTLCLVTPQTLTATATAPLGSTLVWYDAAIGGNVVVSPILNAFGTVTYYAESVDTSINCISIVRTPVTLTINNIPIDPISGGDQIVCQVSPIQTLTATATTSVGSSIVWYNALVGGSVVSPILNTVGTITYYAESLNASATCTSINRTPVSLTINPAPAAPTSGGNQNVCELSPMQTLTANASAPVGSTVVWYTLPTGGTIVASPILNAVGSITYYAQSVNSTTNCVSLTRTPVNLRINAAPAAPTSGGNQTVCQGSPIQTLTATATAPSGSTVVWYDAATGGNVVGSPILNAIGSITYYAQSLHTTSTCTSLTRTAVTLTIQAAPAAPTSGGNQTVCQTSPIQTLTAVATAPVGSTVVWYTAATGGSVVGSPNLNTVGSITYYAQSLNTTTSCTSLTRTAVTLTIQAAPLAPTSGGNQTVCEISPIQTLTATATAPVGSTVVWYDAATGGSIVGSPTLSVVGTITYYAQSVNTTTSCTSLTRTAVTLTIQSTPTIVLTVLPTCSVNLLTYSFEVTVSNGAVSSSSGLVSNVSGNIWSISNIPSGNNVVVTVTGLNLCFSSLSITAPDCSCPSIEAPTSGGNQTVCEISPIQTLTATATAPVGSTVVWYDAAIGGNIVASPILSSVGTITYYAQSLNTTTSCTSLTRTAVTLTIQAAPLAPTSGGNQTVCEISPIQTLTATATAPVGSTVVWYDAATGGNIVASPILSSVGTITYYAQSLNTTTSCTSLTRTAVTLTIQAAPLAPTSGGNQTVCEISPIQTLTATATAPVGSTVVWYDAAIGGNIVASPILSSVGTITYYAQSLNTTTSCTSLTRTAVTLTIQAAPLAPTSGGNQTVCEISLIQTLTATATAPVGSTVVWYDAAIGGNIVASPILSSVGTITYYAQSLNTTTSCVSLTRTAVTLTIQAAPLAPTSGGNQTVCEISPIQTLTATATAPVGSTVVWYDAATGGNIVASPILSSVGTITYYAQSLNTTTSCTSLTRTAVTLTIQAAPLAPTSGGDQTVCEISPIQTLTATATAPVGSTVVWYDAATGGNIVASPILSSVGTITYYAQSLNTTTSCTSLTRTAVTLTIQAAPLAPTSGGNQTVCEISPIQTLTATATAPVGSTVVWYDAAIGGNIVASPILSSVGTITYYAQSLNSTTSCTSLTRTAVTLTIQAAPLAPTSGGDQTVCEISPIQTLTATATAPVGSTVVWYDAAIGGNIVASPILSSVGTITYYAQSLNSTTSCTSLTRTAVTLTIQAAPLAPTSGGNQTVCEISPIQTLTATATAPVGSTVVWYDAATGGSIVGSPTLSVVGTITYYAQSVNTTTSCTSLTRTAVTLTIQSTPTIVLTVLPTCSVNLLTYSFEVTVSNGTVSSSSGLVSNVSGNIWSISNIPSGNNVVVTVTGLNLCFSSLSITAPDCSCPSIEAPTSGGNQTVCEISPIQTLTATATAPVGSTVVWYDAAIGGNIVASPILNTVGTITYYAQSLQTATSCTSLTRTAVTLTIQAAPLAPTSGGNQTVCEISPIQTLTATATAPVGSTVVWYDAAIGGNIVASPILSSVGTITYYAQSLNTTTSCTSLTRTAVTLTIQAAPLAPTSGGNQTVCEISPIQTLTATATAPVGSTVVWYDAAIGGNIVASPILSSVGTITYYAQSLNTTTSCTSLTRTAVTLTIQAAPLAPTSGGNQTVCEISPIQTLTATATAPVGSTVVWYDAATGGNIVASPILSSVGTITYYAQSLNTTTSCTSLTRTAVTLTIQAAPLAPTSGGNQTVCEISPIQTLTATATAPVGSTVVWYDAATGGNIVASPILNTVGTITYYAQSLQTATSCTSLTRTAVTLTIQAAPLAPTSGGNQTVCEISPIQTLIATATAPVGSTVVWYDAAIGGNIVASPILSSVGTITYYAQSLNTTTSCTSLTRTAVTLTIQAAPLAPTSGGNQTVCEISPIQTLTATATAPVGSTVVWYDAATGGNIVASPILNTVGTITYYAQSLNSTTSCTSLTRTAVTLTIQAAPLAPTSGGNQTVCEISPIQTLTATATAPVGSTVVWYDAATGGNIVASPILSSVGTITYYAQSLNTTTSCTSLTRTAVTLTIQAAPLAPTSGGNQTVCEISPIQTLTATATAPVGSTVVWYDAATGGNIVASPILSSVGTITYYAQSLNTTTSCTSLTRTAVTLTIQAAPLAPTSGGNQTVCEISPIQTLTATATAPVGSTVVWYDAATGGSIVGSPILSAVGTITYYAQSVNTTTSCTSLTRTAVTLTIQAAPLAPTSGGNQTVCEISPIQTLTATATAPVGSTVVWYDAATGGNIVASPILNTVGTITYYAQSLQTATSCTSLTRTAVTLTIQAAPLAPTSGGNQTVCEISPIQTLTATATAPVGSTVVWYDAATGGNIVASPILSSVGTITYYAQSLNTTTSCTSLTRTAVTLTIQAAPLAPTSGGNQTVCEISPIQTLTATATAPVGSTVVWYDAATGGNIVASPILSSVGTITYYAQSLNTTTSCTSLTRTAVTLTIQAAPLAPTSGGNQTVCEISPIQTLTATATASVGSTVVWYDAATGGSIVGSPILSAVGTITYYAQSVNTTTSCTSLTRTAVTLTIQAAPLAPTSGGNQTVCEISPIQTLTATATAPVGSTVVWYDAAIGGNIVASPILNTVGTITYYAQSLNSTTSCTSLTRTAVTLTIQAAPLAPTSGGNQTVCEISPIQTLTATATAPVGSTVVWYDAATGGNIVASPILSSVGTITYYAQSLNTTTSCTSLTRTAVTLTIQAAPLAPTSGGNQTVCEISPIQTLTATATAPVGSTVVWYDAAIGGNIVVSPILSSVGTITYYAQSLNTTTSCTSLTRTAVTLTIQAAPLAPTSGGDQTVCEISPIQTLTATATAPVGSTVVWYDAATGGNIVASPILNTVGTITYYAQSLNTTTSCTSLTRTAVTLTIQAAPLAPTSGGDQTVCEISPIQTLTATATAPVGSTVVWYDAAIGGNIVASPILSSVGTITYYAQSLNTTTSCISLTRTAVTLAIETIFSTPIADSLMQFCTSDNALLSDVSNQVIGTNLVFWDNFVGGNQLLLSTLLVDGMQVWVSQGSGICSARLLINIQVDDNVFAPIASTPMQFCISDNSEISDVSIQVLGVNLIFWDSASGGNQIPQTTLLNNGMQVWVSQGTSSCAERLLIDIQVNNVVLAPTGDSPMQFCSADNFTLSTVASQVNGVNLIFWDDPLAGNQMPLSMVLTDGLQVWVSQGLGTCADRLLIDIIIEQAVEAPIGDSPMQFCTADNFTLAEVANQVVGINLIFWDSIGGNQLPQTTLLTDGMQVWVSQGLESCTEYLLIDIQVDDLVLAPLANSPMQFCIGDNFTLSTVASQVTGINLIFWDAPSGGNQLPQSTVLVDGMQVWVTQGIQSCNIPLLIDINLLTDIPAPTGAGTQAFCLADGQTLADLHVFNTTGFSSILWFADAGQTTPLNPTTLLVDGTTYYAFQGVGSCAVALAVTVQGETDIPAPTGAGTQAFCLADGQTLADLHVFNTTGFSSILWFADAGQTTPLNPTTLLVDGTTYYAFQGVGSCAVALAVTVQGETDIPAPTGAGTQAFCLADGQTLADLHVFNTTGFSSILWFADAGQTTPLNPTTLLVDGTTYYAFQGVGSCAVALAVTVQGETDIPAPTGAGTQAFCLADGQTLADLHVFNTTGFSSILWFADAGQTTPLNPTTLLVDGTTYYAFQGVGSCAVALAVTVQGETDIPAPTGAGTQAFCLADGQTLADLHVFNTTGFSSILWFADAGQTTPLNPTTLLVDGTTYYAFQGVGSCAVALAVTVQGETDIPAPTGAGTQAFCLADGQTLADLHVFNTTGFSSILWFADAGQTTPLNPTTLLVDGTTYYAFQGVGSCAVALAVTVQGETDIPAPTGAGTQAFC